MRLGLDFCCFFWYNTLMITKTQIKSGAEALLDLSSPVFVGDVKDGLAWVMDQDGGEQWVSVNRLDEVAPLPVPSQKQLDEEAWDAMEREERMSDFWSFFRKSLDNLTLFLILLIMTKLPSTPSVKIFNPWGNMSETDFADFEAKMLREQEDRAHAEAAKCEQLFQRELVHTADFR